MNKISNLVIGQGLGPIKFGMTRNEIIELIGKPDEEETEENGDDKILTMFYDNILTDFTLELFEGDDENGEDVYRLTSLLCTNPEYTLDNKIHFGDTEQQFVKYTKSLKAADADIQVDQDTKERFLYYDDLGLMAIFDEEGLSTIQLEYWDDDEPEE